MTLKSMNYDHPAYLVRFMAGGTLSGNQGVTQKFAAFAAMRIKSIHTGIQTAGTSADQPYFFHVSQGTATSTQTLSAISSAGTNPKNNVGTSTLASGDVFWVAKGTDTTLVMGCGIEIEIVQCADLTA